MESPKPTNKGFRAMRIVRLAVWRWDGHKKRWHCEGLVTAASAQARLAELRAANPKKIYIVTTKKPTEKPR